MAYVAVDKNEAEWIFESKPVRYKSGRTVDQWRPKDGDRQVHILRGSIEKLIGKKLTWEDEPVELKGYDDDTNI